ncbi:M28 family peptidase [Sphingomicrobium clamense]|uniref:Carboxypeptidase Q n=1 Tax=Sphingomicrobium clamense TaxID=2851013 RepID=A0ABS6V6B1_9SPHN|nr:M28 family peptidase [Sphingomicrobium sp. B8]MBW0145112.1 M28 family peptidase [Sphingomicrobium sp. B8]
MTKSFLARAALLASAPLLLASAQPMMMPPVDDKVAELRDAALDDEMAWDILETLTTEIGPRLGGTPAEARARAWSVERLTAMGFSNVRVEEFQMDTWVRGEERASIVAPFPQDLVVTALGNSGSTNGELTAEVVGYDNFWDFAAAPAEDVAGKIVYISHAMPANQDGSGYGAYGVGRFVGPNMAAQRGAAAILVKSIGTDHNRTPHTGNTNFQDGVTPIPAGALSVPDGEQLERVLERGRPVTISLTLTSRRIGMQTSGNVIAEVPGRDPDAKKVLVACHLDSWDNSPGVFDDGAGCAIVASAAKRIMDAGTPARTIQVVWFGAEEVGIHGGADFAERHNGTDYHLVAESDFGADRIWKIDTNLGEDRKAETDALRAALYPLGIVPGSYEAAGGADIGPLMREGAPGIGLRQDGTRYFDLHHTSNDTLDKVDPAQLKQNVAAWTAMLAVAAGPVE